MRFTRTVRAIIGRGRANGTNRDWLAISSNINGEQQPVSVNVDYSEIAKEVKTVLCDFAKLYLQSCQITRL